jgi:hypothetical protein
MSIMFHIKVYKKNFLSINFMLMKFFCDCENPYLKINDVKGAKKFYEDLINTFIVND